jgi:hypothetical protein
MNQWPKTQYHQNVCRRVAAVQEMHRARVQPSVWNRTQT